MQVASKPETTNIDRSPSETITLDVSGMKCAGCVKAVERQLTQQTGVISALVNLATEVATVQCETGAIDPNILAEKLTNNGFPTQPRLDTSEIDATKKQTERHNQEIKQQIRRIAIAAFLIILSVIGHLGHFISLEIPILSNIWFHAALATLALLLPGREIIIDGVQSLWRNAPNMNTLVGLGALTAYIASVVALLFPELGWECFFGEPVMILGFILLGKTLEQQARYRAASTLQSLIALQPATARLVPPPNGENNFESVEIPASRVKVGEYLQVLPGEKIPVDGEICNGKTTIDESMLTGESIPVTKECGAKVTAGTINNSGAIVIQATHTGSETTLAQIVKLVETAQTRKAPIQNLADTVAGYFTYGVMTIASATFLFWYFAGTNIWPNVLQITNHEGMMMAHSTSTSPLLLSLKLTIAVLVIACPCALGLATPTAILVGSGVGAERGLLIKGGDVLEKVHELDTIVFDKTGTLTTGHPTVTDIVGDNPQWLLQVAATVESGASHPLAKAILQKAQQEGVSLLTATDFHTEAGLGISAVVDGKPVLVGNLEWLKSHEIIVNAENIPTLNGKTTVYIAVDGILAGVIGVSDVLRDDAKATVQRLQSMGLRVMLLTGDRSSVAETIGQQLNINSKDILAEVAPSGKAEAIASLQSNAGKVAMVGDGINDAPALAQANVGIGMQAGTDVAMEAADIVLMQDKLMDVVQSIKLSRTTFNKIRQNLFWAFAYNIVGIPVAAGVLLPSFGIILNPAVAGAFMAFSSVSVVTNSLLLRSTFR
ncbi:MAG: copper-translocating P-type ATPase [Okeania sp. SIO3B5]|uniref:heavy metal translocating P-type ATPase n=1 Tax=Okeania sp. SIO3B5 TaxID=2607811 RepID=UPI0013FEC563|nr:heavy metal translocating P-type ATPase [Okeania sp. SIO3B5]NEO55985.1 copper-translocating P-type ATPase [Okeania sp. SIO3B5]